MIQSGQEGLFSAFAEQGDPAYLEFWNRVKNKPEETVYDDIGEGLKQMAEKMVVIHVNEAMLWRYFEDRPYINQQIGIVTKEKFHYGAIILTKNSPLTPIFKSGIVSYMQSGVTDRIKSKYINSQSQGIFDGIMVLNMGQVLLVFIIIGIAMPITIIILLLECVLKKTNIIRMCPLAIL